MMHRVGSASPCSKLVMHTVTKLWGRTHLMHKIVNMQSARNRSGMLALHLQHHDVCMFSLLPVCALLASEQHYIHVKPKAC